MEKEIIRIIEESLSQKMGYAVVRVSNLKLTYDIAVETVDQPKNKTYISTEQPKKKYKKRKFRRTGQFSLSRDYTTSPEDIKVMRTFLGGWQREGILTDSIKIELSKTRGKFSTSLDREQRLNVLKMFNQTRQQLAFNNGKLQ